MIPRVVLVSLFVCSGCSEPLPPGTIEAIVLDTNQDGEYGLVPRTIEVESVSPLRNARFELIGGATLSSAGGEEMVSGGSPLEVSYEQGPPIVPGDYESLLAFTMLYHYEFAYAFYRELGLGTDMPEPARFQVYIYPRVHETIVPVSTFADNAAFSPGLHGFIVAPESISSGEVPISMDAHVSVHELGHAMYDHLVFVTRSSRRVGTYWLSALNEGLADTFAVAATGDPDMLGDAYSEAFASAAEARDVSREWTLTQELEDAAEARAASFYRIGTLVARTFWLYAQLTQARHGDLRTALVAGAQLAFDALRVLDVSAIGHTVDFFEQLLSALPADSPDRAPLCEALAQTFGLVLDRVGECP